MSDTCRLFPPFGDPWPSCLLPSQGLTPGHGTKISYAMQCGQKKIFFLNYYIKVWPFIVFEISMKQLGLPEPKYFTIHKLKKKVIHK